MASPPLFCWRISMRNHSAPLHGWCPWLNVVDGERNKGHTSSTCETGLAIGVVLKSQRSQRSCECFWHYFVAINCKLFWKRQQVSIVFQECHSWSIKHDIPLKVPEALPTKMGVIQKFLSDLTGITVYPRQDPRFSGTFGSGKAEIIGNTLIVAGCIFEQVLP